jgi:hypothetical protein
VRRPKVEERSEATGRPVVVEVIPVEASRLVTIGPLHRVWQSSGDFANPFLDQSEVQGTFVRIKPPKDCPSHFVEMLRTYIEGLARAVKVDAWEKSGVAEHLPAEQARSHKSIRQVIGRLIDEARTTNREKLRETTDAALLKVGI